HGLLRSFRITARASRDRYLYWHAGYRWSCEKRWHWHCVLSLRTNIGSGRASRECVLYRRSDRLPESTLEECVCPNAYPIYRTFGRSTGGAFGLWVDMVPGEIVAGLLIPAKDRVFCCPLSGLAR